MKISYKEAFSRFSDWHPSPFLCMCIFDVHVFHFLKGRLPIFNIVRIFFCCRADFIWSLILNVVNFYLVPSANFTFKLKPENSSVKFLLFFVNRKNVCVKKCKLTIQFKCSVKTRLNTVAV